MKTTDFHEFSFKILICYISTMTELTLNHDCISLIIDLLPIELASVLDRSYYKRSLPRYKNVCFSESKMLNTLLTNRHAFEELEFPHPILGKYCDLNHIETIDGIQPSISLDGGEKGCIEYTLDEICGITVFVVMCRGLVEYYCVNPEYQETQRLGKWYRYYPDHNKETRYVFGEPKMPRKSGYYCFSPYCWECENPAITSLRSEMEQLQIELFETS